MFVSHRQLRRKFNLVLVGDSLPMLHFAQRMASEGFEVLVLPHPGTTQSHSQWTNSAPFRHANSAPVWNFPDAQLPAAAPTGQPVPGMVRRQTKRDLVVLAPSKGEVTVSTDFSETLASLSASFPNEMKKIYQLFVELEDIAKGFCELHRFSERLNNPCAVALTWPALMQNAAKAISTAQQPLGSLIDERVKSRKFRELLDLWLQWEVQLTLDECPVALGALVLTAGKFLGWRNQSLTRDELRVWLPTLEHTPNLTISTDAELKYIVVDGGITSGVALSDGRHIRADFVLLDPDGCASPLGLFADRTARQNLAWLESTVSRTLTRHQWWYRSTDPSNEGPLPAFWRDSEGILHHRERDGEYLVVTTLTDDELPAHLSRPLAGELLWYGSSPLHVPKRPAAGSDLRAWGLTDASAPFTKVSDLFVLPYRAYAERSQSFRYAQLASFGSWLLDPDQEPMPVGNSALDWLEKLSPMSLFPSWLSRTESH